MPPQVTSRGREVATILVLTCFGAVVRLVGAGRLGFEHFDEGIYAGAGLWSLTSGAFGRFDPEAIAYSPPGFPILVGISYLFLGINDFAAIAVSLAAGIATIPVVGWLGRRTFGPGAGAASAAFAAFSGPHLAFSRMALTDATFLLGWLAALGLGARFLERPTFGRSLALGLAVGLAQNLKYNGWLAGAIVGLAASIEIVALRPFPPRRAASLLGWGGLAAVVATGLYIPWYLFVERHHGYESLLAHHRAYLVGLSSWLPNWRIQLGEAVALSGGPVAGLAAWSFAFLGWKLAVSGRTGTEAGPTGLRVRLFILAGGVLLAAMPNLGWWVGIAASWLLATRQPAPRLLGVCWVVMSILTPFYYPYARLWLPLHAAGWLILGGALAALLRDPSRWIGQGSVRRFRVAIGGACLVAAAWQVFGSSPRPRPMAGLLEPTDDLRRIVDALEAEADTPPLAGATLLTIARPAAVFYLALGDRIRSEPLSRSNLLFEPHAGLGPTLVDEIQLRQSGEVEDALARLRFHWRVVREFEDRPNPPTLLDVDPINGFDPNMSRRSRIWLLVPADRPSEEDP